MKPLYLAAILMLAAIPALAQPAAPAMPDAKLFADPADVQSLIAKAKAMPPQPMILQPLLTQGGYTVMLEYRAGAANPPSVHPADNELIYVIDGSGTLLQGGTITDKKTIDGGTPRALAKGDVALVPEGVPHQLIPAAGVPLILMSLRSPPPPPAK